MKFQATEFYFTAIYGLQTVGNRRNLWTELKQLGTLQQGSWLLMGDYNVVLQVDDRINGADVQEQELKISRTS